MNAQNDGNGTSPLAIALAARVFELEQFWRRALFFWGFIAAAFVALAGTYGDDSVIAIAVSCFGTVCSWSWALANRGSKYWYESWEAKVKRLGGEEITELFENDEPPRRDGLWGACRFSVSKIAIALSDFTFVLWVVLLSLQVLQYFGVSYECWEPESVAIAVLLTVTASYVCMLFLFGRGKTKRLSGATRGAAQVE